MSDLEDLKGRIINALGDNLVCILLTGSRARGEERDDSDYDLAIIIHKIDEEALIKLRSIFSGLANYSVYLIDDGNIESYPKATFLQFVYSKKLYGDFNYTLPTKSDIADYIGTIRRDWLDRIRHYVIIPHPHERLVKALIPALKCVYLTLSYLIYGETGYLPRTREETIAVLRRKEGNSLGMDLMKILEDWDASKEGCLTDPVKLLLQIEAFFRTVEI